VLHLLREVVLGERQLGGGERRLLDRGDLVRVVQDRAVGVGADLEAAAVLALVHAHVHVADDRVLDARRGLREPRHRADVDHLMHGRRERDRSAGHMRQARAPHAAGDHDDLGLHVAASGAHAAYAPALDVDAEHLRVGRDGERALPLRLLAHQRPGPKRVDHADPGCIEAAQQDALVDERDELLDLGWADERHRLDAPRLRRRHAPAQLLHALLGARDLEPAALDEDVELLVLAHAVEGQRGHLAGVVDGIDEVRRVSGRPARVGQRALVDQDEIAPAEPREVVDEAVADDAGADDDRSGGARQRACSRLLFH
jgi:hypothetical protein